ncbi:MAG TPA: hypothetical protein VGM32_24530 [Rhodopila sp.]|jgi:hypothetical protein
MIDGNGNRSVSSQVALRAQPVEARVVRLDRLTTEVGWLLVTAGVIGVIVPGIPGMPFLLVGVLVVTPGGSKLLSRWAGDTPPRFLNGAMKQLGRFLDDLERRYP